MITVDDESRWRNKLLSQGYSPEQITRIIETWKSEIEELDRVFAGKPRTSLDIDDVAVPHCNED